MNNIQFIYFDVGEVLIAGAHSKDIAQIVNIPNEQFRPVFKKYKEQALKGKITSDQLLENLKRELPIDPLLIDYPSLWIKSIRPLYETQQFVRELEEKYLLGMLTNMSSHLIDALAKEKLLSLSPFHTIIQSHEVGIMKPEKEIFFLAQEKANIAPKHILFIDDNKENVIMAKELGWQGFTFDSNNPAQSITYIKELLL